MFNVVKQSYPSFDNYLQNTFDTFFFNLNPAEVNQDQNINTL